MLNRAININHLFAMCAPAQHLVKERAFTLAFVNQIDQRRDERNWDKRKIAQIIEQQLQLKNYDIAQKPPTLAGARR